MNLQQGGIIAGVLLMLFGGDVMSLFHSSATVRAQQAADEGQTHFFVLARSLLQPAIAPDYVLA